MSAVITFEAVDDPDANVEVDRSDRGRVVVHSVVDGLDICTIKNLNTGTQSCVESISDSRGHTCLLKFGYTTTEGYGVVSNMNLDIDARPCSIAMRDLAAALGQVFGFQVVDLDDSESK